MGSRGQTTQDFAIGVSVLLVTIIGAFAFTQGGALAVYQGTSPGVDQPQADRIASYLVEEYSLAESDNTLRYASGSGSIDSDLSQDPNDGTTNKLKGLIQAAGVDVSSDRRADPIVNVSIVNGETLRDGGRTPATDLNDDGSWGEYRRSESVSSSRVVRLTNYDCDPVCWLVVRIW